MRKQVVLDMAKKFELNMEKKGIITFPILRTRAAIDNSGSMSNNFSNGYVGKSVDRFIAAALKFDDNGELEIGFFNTTFTETPVATLEDAGQYMTTKGRNIYANGGTEFAPIVEWTLEEDTREGVVQPTGFLGGLKKLFGAKPESSLPDCGQYTGIITDGSLNGGSSVSRFESMLKKTDAKDSFFQFIGIGNQVDTDYLNSVSSRFPNVGFVHIPNPSQIDDDAFYALLANDKFVGWVAAYNAARGVK